MTLHVADSPINVYRPALGEPRNRFTVAATALDAATPPAPPRTRVERTNHLTIDAPEPLRGLLVRVPDGVALTVDARRGDVAVTDITGSVDVRTGAGDVRILVPGVAQAATGSGHLSVTMGSAQWNGTLRYSSGNGDVEVWINENAQFVAHLRTDDGTLFTDFGLRGVSNGTIEQIDGPVNGGAMRAIDIHVLKGNIRLLRLHPEA